MPIPPNDDVTFMLPEQQEVEEDEIYEDSSDDDYEEYFHIDHKSRGSESEDIKKLNFLFAEQNMNKKSSVDQQEEIYYESSDDDDYEEFFHIDHNKSRSGDTTSEDTRKQTISAKIKHSLIIEKSDKIDDYSKELTLKDQKCLQKLAKKFLLNNTNADFVMENKDKTVGVKKTNFAQEKKHRNAIEAIANGECSSVSKACRKYGVNQKTLARLLKTGRNYQGRGKTSLIFSKAEERIIAERIKQFQKNGEISRKLVMEILSQEFAIAKRDNPERIISKSLPDHFIDSFWARNNLHGYSLYDEYSRQLQKYAKKLSFDELDGDSAFDENYKTFMGAKKINNVRKEKLRNAVKAIARGEFSTIRAASEKFKVPHQILSYFLKLGQNIQEDSQIFTKTEEKIIKDKILHSLEKQNISRRFVQKILLKEFGIVKRDNPERNLPNSLPQRFLEGFLVRNNLNEEEILSEGNEQRLQELAKKFLMSNTKKDLLIDDKSIGVKKTDTQKIEMYRKAIEAIARGECHSLSSASEKYGVLRKTLGNLLHSGRDFQGKGNISLVFSKAEERILTERILQKLQNMDASRSVVKDMILQEFEIIKRDKPERNLPNSLSSRFLYGFLARNNLNGYSTLKPKSKVKKLQKYQDLAKKFLLINKEFIFLCESLGVKKTKKKEMRRYRYINAAKAVAKGEYTSITAAAKKHGVDWSRFVLYLKSGEKFQDF